MGYYFTGINSNYVSGIKNGDEYLVMRSDIASKKINAYYETIVPKDFGSLSIKMFTLLALFHNMKRKNIVRTTAMMRWLGNAQHMKNLDQN